MSILRGAGFSLIPVDQPEARASQDAHRSPSRGSAEIYVAPFLAVVFGEPGLDRVLLAGAAGGDGSAVDVLDSALDVVALRSLRDHREKPAKTDVTAVAALDVDQAAISDRATAIRGHGEPLELRGTGVLERLR